MKLEFKELFSCLCDITEGSLDGPADAGLYRGAPVQPARELGADADEGLDFGRLPERCGLAPAGREG